MSTSKLPKFLLGVTGAVVCAVLLSGSVHGYYDDTHYGLTYYIARSCGFTAMQAHRIASADLSIDYSDLTEPVQKARSIEALAANDLGVGIAQAGVNAGRAVTNTSDPLGGDFQEPRVRYHAFRDARPLERRLATPAQIAIANEEIRAQRNVLSALATRQRNPGVLLHFIQDESSHRGYASLGGHWLSASNTRVSTLADPNKKIGATTDYLSFDDAANRDMIRATIATLTNFMSATATAQRPAPCNLAQIADQPDANGPSILQLLVAANPVSEVPTQYIRQLPNTIGDFLNVGEGSPNASVADRAVRAKLGATEIVPYADHTNRIRYEFDRHGNVTNLPTGLVSGSLDTLGSVANPLDGLTLYGNLRVTLGGPGATGRPVQVSVWAAPTRTTEQPYQLDCHVETATTAEFFNLPVGSLILQAVSGDVVTRQSITLNRLMQNETLRLPADDRVANDCPRPVDADVFSRSCMISRGISARRAGGAPMDATSLSQARQSESPISDLVDGAGSCRATPPSGRTTSRTSTPTTGEPPKANPPKREPKPPEQDQPKPPKQGGNKAAQITLALAAAVGGGILLASALENVTPKDCGTQPDQPSIFDSNYTSKFASYKNQMSSWCKCRGFSTFSGGTCVK